MSESAGWYLGLIGHLIAGLLGAWTAFACSRAQQRGMPGSDAVVWAGLATVFLLYFQVRFVRAWGLSSRLGQWLRSIAKQHGWYANRRTYQIIATIAVAVIAVALLLYGLIWVWHYIDRYRLAIGFASIAVGFAVVRFISLHEVDAWNAALPWVRTVVDLATTTGASGVAILRLSQLGEFNWLWGSG